MISKKSKKPESTKESKSLNRGLTAAKIAKQDEFYTQYVDIQKEVEAYLEFDPSTFRDKVVYCNCDDPFESNFFKYFAANFNKLGLKKLISTSYDGSPIAGQYTLFPEYNAGNDKRQRPKAIAVILDHVKDEDGDGATNLEDVKLFLKRNKAARIALKGNDNYAGGDFRSSECITLLKESDIVVSNPPFSLFREYVALLVKHRKKLLIIGNTNSITYKDIFPHIKDNRLWLGCTNFNVGMFFEVPDNWKHFHHIDKDTGRKIARVSTSCWYTNLDHGRRHEPLNLMTMADNLRFSKNLKGKTSYQRYNNETYTTTKQYLRIKEKNCADCDYGLIYLPNLYYNLAKANLKVGNIDNYHKYRKYLVTEKKNIILDMLDFDEADDLKNKGEFNQSEMKLKQIYLSSKSTLLKARALYFTANLYYSQNKIEKAKEKFYQIINEFPDIGYADNAKNMITFLQK